MVDGPCATCAYIGLIPQASEQPRTTRVQELLRHNRPPLEVELADLRAVVDNSAAVILDLDAKIVRAQEVLEHLMQARTRAESHLADAKAILHPMRSLPTEILSEIFNLCAPSWGHSFSFECDSLEQDYPPWTVLQVCRRWRDLALSLPAIWNYLEVDFLMRPSSEIVHKTRTYLSRSGNSPVDVCMEDVDDSDFEPYLHNPLVGVMKANVHRFRRLSISGSSAPLRCLSGSVFSCLTYLRLSHLPDDDDMLTTLSSPASAPRLRELEVYSWADYTSVHLPWAQLTSLAVHGDLDHDGWNFLKQMSNLEILTAVLDRFREPVTRLSLPKLVSLHLSINYIWASTAVKEFVSAFDVPKLSKLSLIFPISQYPDASSLRNVTDLTIQIRFDGFFSVEAFFDFLSQIDHVEVFRLSCCNMAIGDWHTGLFAGLELSSTDSNFCLTHVCVFKLDINVRDWRDFEDKRPLWRMLRSRYGSAHDWDARLETFIVPRHIYDDEDEDWLSIRSSSLHVECGLFDDE